MKLLAIDPGYTQSAHVLYDTEEAKPMVWATLSNAKTLQVIDTLGFGPDAFELLAVEMVASYGMPVGKEVFETVLWAGRFVERAPCDVRLIYRADVKLHLTNSRRSKDPHVRQALLDKFGPGKELAVGKKASPGPLYGLTGDCWAALGVAVTAAETDAGRLVTT